MTKAGVPGVKAAKLVFDYTLSQTGQASGEQYAWTPPAGARDVSVAAPDNQSATALVGKAAPDFSLPDPDFTGRTVKLADAKGKLLLLVFWSTGAAPSFELLPQISKLQAAEQGKGLMTYAINVGDDKEKAQGALKSRKINLPGLLDDHDQAHRAYLVSEYPTAVLIGKDGIVRKVWMGSLPTTADEIRAEVEVALK
jgi:peroxiredoxin